MVVARALLSGNSGTFVPSLSLINLIAIGFANCWLIQSTFGPFGLRKCEALSRSLDAGPLREPQDRLRDGAFAPPQAERLQVMAGSSLFKFFDPLSGTISKTSRGIGTAE